MNKIIIIVIIFVVYSFYSFNRFVSKSSPNHSKEVKISIAEDFYFVITDGRSDSYNSKTGVFVREYSEYEKTLKIELTKEDKDKIYLVINEIKFFEMPNNFEPRERIVQIKDPGCIKSIVIYSGGKLKNVSYNTGFTSEKNKKRAKHFFRLYDMIWEVLKSKDELKNLPVSDIRFL